MLSIERLSMALPPGFEHRAAAIAELLAERLAAMPAAGGHDVGPLRVEHVLDGGDATDESIAGDLAVAVWRQLRPPDQVGDPPAGGRGAG